MKVNEAERRKLMQSKKMILKPIILHSEELKQVCLQSETYQFTVFFSDQT